MNIPTPAKLTTPERLALPRLGSNPTTAVTRNAFAEILQVCPKTAGGILLSLVAKGFAARTPQYRNTRFWRVKNADSGTVSIYPGTTLDDSIAALQARAAQADNLERALSQILTILTDHGIRVPEPVEPQELSKMTAKHLRALAIAFARTRPPADAPTTAQHQWHIDRNAIIAACTAANPRFDEGSFVTATENQQ